MWLLVRFLELFLPAGELADWKEKIRRGGNGAPGYGHMKNRLIEAIDAAFGDARKRREELLAHPSEVDAILAKGGARARERARRTVDRCYRACGLR